MTPQPEINVVVEYTNDPEARAGFVRALELLIQWIDEDAALDELLVR